MLQKQKVTLGFRVMPVLCSVGVFSHEKESLQEIRISLEVDFALDVPFISDRLEETIDYNALMACSRRVGQEKHYQLIETLASEILTSLGEEFPLLRAEVTVEKMATSTFVKMSRDYA